MRYYKQTEEEFINSIGTGSGGEEITEKEYETILSVIHNRPVPDTGYDYRLKSDLTWELVELPPEQEHDSEATESDYIAALAELGVTVDEEI